ncbi:hypothetical protein [Streptomyces qinglanensis]|uniref:hypothetical protein n=1 Tax=Streptomyces qinglanensis TaxID=943816 RepID=UPI003D708130
MAPETLSDQLSAVAPNIHRELWDAPKALAERLRKATASDAPALVKLSAWRAAQQILMAAGIPETASA